MKDIIIIGGGPGGYEAAIRGAQLGASIVLVEQDQIGGTCLNRGCIPTKALYRNAEIIEILQHAGDFGIEVGSYTLNIEQIQARKNDVVKNLVDGIQQLINAHKIELVQGHGVIRDGHTVDVQTADGKVTLEGKHIIIASGSKPASIPVPGADLPGIYTSNEMLNFTEIPESLIVIGGGVVGIEFAGIFNAFGSKVTVVDALDQIISFCDSDVTKRLTQILKRKGIDINTKLMVRRIEAIDGGGYRVITEGKKGEVAFEADQLLMAVGRVPNLDKLGLDAAGIAYTKKGITVDENYKTNLDSVYAIGDVNGLWMLAHVASHHGVHTVEHIMGLEPHIDHTVVPACVFVSPEVATVGLTEEQVEASGKPYETNKFMFAANGKALALGEGEGFVKVIECEGKIVGTHIMGPHASDLIHEAALIIRKGMGVKEVGNTIHAHPTLAEAFVEAVLGLHGEAIHQIPKKKRENR